VTTTLVNVRSPEWHEAVANGAAVYIGRRCGSFKDSIWGNPWKVGTKYGIARGDAVELYRQWARGEREHPKGKAFPHGDLEELRGRTLGCWCAPQKCRGEVLLELLNEREPQ
jgi:hypothetical protein